jgi:phosphoglycolate phosphatase-like HAD superfamily hydrolase
MIKNILFDLDGTLLPVNQDEFVIKVMSVMEDELKKTDLDSTDFLKGMLKGIDTIVKESNGSCTNEELFWTIFNKYSNIEAKKAKDFFVNFYNGAYLLATETVVYNTKIADAVTFLKNKGYNLVLALLRFFRKSPSTKE